MKIKNIYTKTTPFYLHTQNYNTNTLKFEDRKQNLKAPCSNFLYKGVNEQDINFCRLYKSVEANKRIDKIINGDDEFDAQRCKKAMEVIKTASMYKSIAISMVNENGVIIAEHNPMVKNSQNKIIHIDTNDILQGIFQASKKLEKENHDNDIPLSETGIYVYNDALAHMKEIAKDEENIKKLTESLGVIKKYANKLDIEIRKIGPGVCVAIINPDTKELIETLSYEQNDFLNGLYYAAKKLEKRKIDDSWIV